MRARGPALHSVLTSFLALYVQPPLPAPTSPPSSPAPASSLSLQQSQQLNRDLQARVEKLSTENAALEQALEEKTDKALDAWAVAQEKYEALEQVTQGMHVQMAAQEELVARLQRRVLEVRASRAVPLCTPQLDRRIWRSCCSLWTFCI